MVRVGERAPGRNDFLEQVNRAVVVLELDALVRLLHQMLRADVHGSPHRGERHGTGRQRAAR
jgi:hypothetical protein